VATVQSDNKTWTISLLIQVIITATNKYSSAVNY